MMWLITEFEAVTLFSLKLSSATASGGKTLLVPTPFALKMALLDAACRTLGVAEAARLWPHLRELEIGLRPAARALVTNLFQKVLRPRKHPVKIEAEDAGPFQKTIGYREYVHLVGTWGLGLGMRDEALAGQLTELLLNVNYLGKRGSFMQVVAPPQVRPELPDGYVLTTSEQTAFPVGGTLQVLDDCTEQLTFEKADIYSDQKVRMGRERITRNIVLPYRMVRASKSFTLYELYPS